MREWSTLLLGAAMGACAALYYLHNEGKVKQQARQIKDCSRRIMGMAGNIGCAVGEMFKR